MKPIAAIRFALNNHVVPSLHIRSVEWVPTKLQWKVKLSERFDDGAWSIGGAYRHTIYFDECFIKRCEEFIKGGVTKWCQERIF
jgi:hypothetical protein